MDPRARPLAAGLTGELLDALYPRRCALCGVSASGGENAIGTCARHRLPRAPAGPRCGVCAARLADVLPDGYRCRDCRRRSPGFRRLVVLADYRPPAGLRDWLLAFKHGGRRDLARPLARALAERLVAAGGPGPDELLVPVPLHPLRRWERGYDQALLLARELERLGAGRVLRALRRRRYTAVQGAAGAASRSANVARAFAPRALLGRSLAGRSPWLVDDVVTTGATLAACARALRRAGAERVRALALARA